MANKLFIVNEDLQIRNEQIKRSLLKNDYRVVNVYLTCPNNLGFQRNKKCERVKDVWKT